MHYILRIYSACLNKLATKQIKWHVLVSEGEAELLLRPLTLTYITFLSVIVCSLIIIVSASQALRSTNFTDLENIISSFRSCRSAEFSNIKHALSLNCFQCSSQHGFHSLCFDWLASDHWFDQRVYNIHVFVQIICIQGIGNVKSASEMAYLIDDSTAFFFLSQY